MERSERGKGKGEGGAPAFVRKSGEGVLEVECMAGEAERSEGERERSEEKARKEAALFSFSSRPSAFLRSEGVVIYVCRRKQD